jgi:hypothetical protein
MRIKSVATIALAAGAILASIALGEQDRFKSTVEIDSFKAEMGNAIFSGAVESPRRACERRRKVIVIGRDEQADNARRRLGTDRTNRRGRFTVTEPIPFAEDFVFAKVKRAELDSGAKCLRDRSPEISTAG